MVSEPYAHVHRTSDASICDFAAAFECSNLREVSLTVKGARKDAHGLGYAYLHPRPFSPRRPPETRPIVIFLSLTYELSQANRPSVNRHFPVKYTWMSTPSLEEDVAPMDLSLSGKNRASTYVVTSISRKNKVISACDCKLCSPSTFQT